MVQVGNVINQWISYIYIYRLQIIKVCTIFKTSHGFNSMSIPTRGRCYCHAHNRVTKSCSHDRQLLVSGSIHYSRQQVAMIIQKLYYLLYVIFVHNFITCYIIHILFHEWHQRLVYSNIFTQMWVFAQNWVLLT